MTDTLKERLLKLGRSEGSAIWEDAETCAKAHAEIERLEREVERLRGRDIPIDTLSDMIVRGAIIEDGKINNPRTLASTIRAALTGGSDHG